MDRQNSDFIGPSVEQWSQKTNLEQGAILFEKKNKLEVTYFSSSDWYIYLFFSRYFFGIKC